VIKYIFDSPQRLRMISAGLAVAVLVLAIALTWTRLATLPTPPAATPTEFATPDSTATDLLPASPAPEGASPTPYYGDSTTAALEAVQAFLLGDRAGFAEMAQQEAVESVNEAPVPPPGQEIIGVPEITLDGPTRQQVRVNTTDGNLLLDMVIVDGQWKVMDLRYEK